jgi:arginine exporter protein ArgO
MHPMQLLHDLFFTILSTVWDVLPIAAIIFGFQLLVLRKPIPNLKKIITGFIFVLLGLAFFLEDSKLRCSRSASSWRNN